MTSALRAERAANDRLRGMRRNTFVAGALLVITSCSATPPTQAPRSPVPAQLICGTVQNPVRVVDNQCQQQRTDVRWYSADPQGLDADDYTAIGTPIDDDYLGEDDDLYVAPRRVTPRTTVRATPGRAPTVRATPTRVRSAPSVDRPTRRSTPTRR